MYDLLALWILLRFVLAIFIGLAAFSYLVAEQNWPQPLAFLVWLLVSLLLLWLFFLV